MQSYELSSSPRAELACLLLALVLAGGAAFGLGALWVSGHLLLVEVLVLALLFVGASLFLVWRSLEHRTQQQKTEAQLHAAQSRFQNLFEQFPSSIQVVRPDGFSVAVNRAWEKLFGLTLENIKHISLLGDETLQENGVSADVRAALGGQTVFSPAQCFPMNQCWPMTSHGPEVNLWIQGTICPVKDDNGKVVELILLHEDITEQKRTQSNLRAAESRFKNLFEQFPLGIQIMRPDGFTAAVNRAWETMFATTYEDVKLMNSLSYSGLKDRGVSDVFRAALEGQVISSPPLLNDMADFGPFTRHKPDVKLWIKGTVCPIKDDEGHVMELITVLEDVTEQKLATDARHESDARRAASVEAALDCIISMDADGIISEWNASAENTFGFSREEALGRPLAELIVPPSLREQHARGLKRYLATGESSIIGRKVEVPAVRANGEEFPVELAIRPIMLGERQIFSGFLRDLTEIKAARDALQKAHDELENRVVQRTLELRTALEQLQTKHEQLEQLEKLRDTLTGMIVHDLRTPLNSMLFGVQTVTFLGTVNPAQQECLNVFVLGCRDSLGVINDLLDIGKMESGVFALHREETEASSIVTQALERIAMLAKVKNLDLVAQVQNSLPTFPADQEKLHRLLGNLLGNAIKFAPPRGTITLGASLNLDEEAIHFWVRDNGAGIPPEAFDRIFEKFGQASAPLGNRETSSGLGLTFCKMIAEAHGGRIWVESQVGEGSTFHFTIPLRLLVL